MNDFDRIKFFEFICIKNLWSWLFIYFIFYVILRIVREDVKCFCVFFEKGIIYNFLICVWMFVLIESFD